MRDYQTVDLDIPCRQWRCTLAQPGAEPGHARFPALDVMTDLGKVAAAPSSRPAPIAAANEYMIARAVRSLFVDRAQRSRRSVS